MYDQTMFSAPFVNSCGQGGFQYHHFAQPQPATNGPAAFFFDEDDLAVADEDIQPFSQFSAKTFEWDTTPELEDLPVPSTSIDYGVEMAAAPLIKDALMVPQMPDSLMSFVATSSKKTHKKGPSKRKRKPTPPKVLTPLPEDFEPSDYSVLCGKGNENFNAPGNRRFRVTVGMFIEEYISSNDRQAKSDLVCKVMHIIRDACPVGAFVKCVKGRWYEVDERTAREKVGARFRDSLHEHYRSSAKSKVARRKKQLRRSSAGSAGTIASTVVSSDSTVTSCSTDGSFSFNL